MPASIGFFVGALLVIYLITKLSFFLLKNWDDRSWPKVIVANALSLCVATVLGGFGLAEGEETFVPMKAFQGYVLPQIVVLFGFLIKNNRKKSSVSATDI